MTQSKTTYLLSLLLYYGFAQYIPERFAIKIFGARIRAMLCKNLFHSCGWGLNCRTRVYFGDGTNVSIGDRSSIGKFSRLYSGSRISIGNHSDIGPWCNIYTQDWRTSTDRFPEPVDIGSDVWIGARCTILKGVTIGDSTIIGAGALVTTNIPDYAIAGGNPATIINYR